MEIIGTRPERKLIGYFLSVIALGTIVLWLPVSHGDRAIGFLDAFFTATSAVCVTGLIVVDTGTAFSTFGQVAILVLIQLGGLGIMTFATGLLLSLVPRLSFQSSFVLTQTFSAGKLFNAHSLVRGVVITTFTMELIGAVFLFGLFLDRFPVGEAAWHATFHAVSAFCNAGFSTFPDSLERFQGSVPIIAVFSILIIAGGLGFAVINELAYSWKKHKLHLSLHSRLCLIATGVLLVIGTICFVFAEWERSLAQLGPVTAVANAFFQSVTARTAGFNTLAQGGLTEVALLVTMILMFIGACPGSTGGGVKATTMSIILLLAYNRLLGRTGVPVFRRSISEDSIQRATTLVLVSTLIIVGLFVVLMFAQDRPPDPLTDHSWFVEMLFETVSAFGTVGLSLGATGELNGVGKIITILLMFTGRVGVLTLMYSLARRRKPGQLIYPDEQVMVG